MVGSDKKNTTLSADYWHIKNFIISFFSANSFFRHNMKVLYTLYSFIVVHSIRVYK